MAQEEKCTLALGSMRQVPHPINSEEKKEKKNVTARIRLTGHRGPGRELGGSRFKATGSTATN